MTYEIHNDFLDIGFDTKGAELTHIRGKESKFEYLWRGDKEFWQGRAPILFPIVGNLNDKKYRIDDKDYSMQRHGFAREMNFDLLQLSNDTAVVGICNNSDTFRQYPFEFRLTIFYNLMERSLKIKYQVENTGDKIMWFSIGGHPGFNCSLKPDGKKDCLLHFSKKEKVNYNVNELGYLTGVHKPFLQNDDKLELSKLDFDGKTNVYIINNFKSERLTLEHAQNEKRVELVIKGFPYLGIWSPSNKAPFVCIEPCYGVTSIKGDKDILNNKGGIISLTARSSFACSYEIICL